MSALEKGRFPTVAALGLAMLTAAALPAQKPAESDLLFQAATHAELIEGNLEQAIRLYRELVSKHAGDRPLAARALVRMGACYQKLRKKEARDAYQRVLREYADQAEAVQIARSRLRELDDSRPTNEAALGSGPTYRMVLDRLIGATEVAFADHQFAFAPDGTRFVFRRTIPEYKSVRLFVADAGGTLVRPLLKDVGSWCCFRYPRWSPDSRRVAYLVHKAPTDAKGPWAIFVADPETREGFQVGPDFPEETPPTDLCWTSDGRAITYLLPDGIDTMTFPAGERRRIQAMKVHWSMRLGGYSPDGGWLAFHQMRDDSHDQTDIDVWVLPTRGGRAVRVTDSPGPDAQAAWAPDGRALYFVSQKSGDLNVWKRPFNPATGESAGAPQQVTFFTDASAMHPTLLAHGRQMAFALSRRQSVINAAEMARSHQARTVVRGSSPHLSPDGRTIFFDGQGPEQQGLFSIPTSGGTPTRLTRRSPFSGFDLSPDGRTLAYFGKEGQEIHLYIAPATGGTPRLLVKGVAEPGGSAPIAFTPPRWSPDGSEIAYARENTLLTISASSSQPRKLAQLYQWQEWLWSPDGRFIGALAYAKPDDIAAFIVPAAGGELRRLTPPEERGYKEGLAWHPDSRRLAYMIYLEPGGRESEVREAYGDGRPTTSLIKRPNEWVYVGRWTPGGERFLYLSNPASKGALYSFTPATGEFNLFAEEVATGGSGLAHGLATWSADGKTVAWTTTSIVSQLWLAQNFR